MHEYLQEFRRLVDYEVNLRKQPLLSPEESEQFNLLSPEEREQLLSKRRQDRIHSGIGLREYHPFHTSFSEWRQEWVKVFSALCEPLYKLVSLPEFGEFKFERDSLSEEDKKATLNCFERFCGETSMNHLLDVDMSVFLIFDCLISLTTLVEHIVGRYTNNSFHFQRISHYRHIKTQIMIHRGFWRNRGESNRDEYLTAIQEIQFPSFEKYFGMSDWEGVS